MKFLLILAFFNGDDIEVIHRPLPTEAACAAYVERWHIENEEVPFSSQCVDIVKLIFTPNPRGS